MMKASFLKWLAVAAILVTGGIHLAEARDAFGDAAYKGLLFVSNGLGALVAAVGIVRLRRWSWWLGLAVAAGAMVAYVLSRTIGLPQLPAEPDAWLEPAGVASLIAEGLFIIAFVAVRGEGSNPRK